MPSQFTLPRPLSQLLLAYYFGPDHPLKLRLWSYLMSALGNPRFVVPYFGGQIAIDPTDWIQNEIMVNGVFDPDVWEAIHSVAEHGEVLWDVGAHVGTLTVRALNDSRFSSVHSFEPHPSTFEALKLNLKLNPGKGHVYNLALAAVPGPKEIFEGTPRNSGLASLLPKWGTKKIQIHCETADRLAATQKIPPPTILKIDVEGAEWMVLEGANDLLSTSPPKLIVFEAEAIGEKFVEPRLRPLLEKFGYTISPLDNSRVSQTEVICRNWRAVR